MSSPGLWRVPRGAVQLPSSWSLSVHPRRWPCSLGQDLSSTFRKFVPDTHTYPSSWKRPGKRQERTLSGLTENRYTFTAWPALCKTREDQTVMSPGTAKRGCSTHPSAKQTWRNETALSGSGLLTCSQPPGPPPFHPRTQPHESEIMPLEAHSFGFFHGSVLKRRN